MGQNELNIFSGHPQLSVNPQLFIISTAPVVEGLFAWDSNMEAVPLLAESWSIPDDFLTWTGLSISGKESSSTKATGK